jgi:hypothetical protein
LSLNITAYKKGYTLNFRSKEKGNEMKIKIVKKYLLPTVTASLLAVQMSNVSAGPIGIYEYSAFLNSSSLGATSLQDTQIGAGYNDFGGAGLSLSFQNNLNANNLGTVTWTIQNTTGADLQNVSFFGFLDAEINEPTNTFFNETGDASGLTLGSGAGDSAADSWEINDPFASNIFNDVLDGNLANTNGLSGTLSDVSMALGFDVGTLLAGEILTATFEISSQDNGGLLHTDSGTSDLYYWNGILSTGFATQVPAPQTLLLMIAGFAGFYAARRKVN